MMTRIVKERGSKGIRSYGPGKFSTLIDSYAYESTLDGGADEEVGYDDGSGWFGLLWLDGPGTRDRIREIAREADGELTDAESELLDDTQAVIFFERSDGIVETDWHAEQEEAERSWKGIEADFEEDEDEEDDEED